MTVGLRLPALGALLALHVSACSTTAARVDDAGGAPDCGGRDACDSLTSETCDGADTCVTSEAGEIADTGDVWPRDAADGGGATRTGASPGVVCHRIPAPYQRGLLSYDGSGERVVFHASAGPSAPFLPYSFDRRTNAVSVLDDFASLTLPGRAVGTWSLALDGSWLAYEAEFYDDGIHVASYQLRLLNLETGARSEITHNQPYIWPEGTTAVGIDGVDLDYPWVVWIDARAEVYDNQYAYAANIETGAVFSLTPREVTGVTRVRLEGTTAVFSPSNDIAMSDLSTRTWSYVVHQPEVSQWAPVITPSWIAWLDQRSHPECDWFHPCSTEIWGMDRATGEVRALVASFGMHGPSLDGRGDWLAYDDQRNGPDPTTDADDQSDIYVLNLVTMHEYRIEDWPGFQAWPVLADGHVLFYEQVDYVHALNDLWDCTLP